MIDVASIIKAEKCINQSEPPGSIDTSNFYTNDNPSGFITGVDLSNYAENSDIFNSAVEWTVNHTLADGTRYLAGDLVYFSGKVYKANYDNESLPVTNTLYWTDLGPGYRLNIDGRDIPNIPQVDVSNLYPNDNPSGFITGVDNISIENVIYTTGNQIKTGNLSLSLANQEVEFELGFSMMAYVRNVESTDITKGEVVYISGAQGDRAAVARASNNSEITASTTFGVAKHRIPSHGDGYIISHGQLKNTNLLINPFQNGDQVYLGSTPGSITRVKPVAPNHSVLVGFVEKKSNGNNGILYVKIQNGYEIDELHDVKISNPQSGEFIVRDSSNQYWTNTGINLSAITNAVTNEPGDAVTIEKLRALTQAEYDAIDHNPNTIYFIL
jgi:hypothetical protein